MVAKTITKKKYLKIELLNSLRESDTVEEREIDINNIIDQEEAIDIIKHYEEIIKMRNKKKTITYEEVQGQMLKGLKMRTN